ncbi:right-handed parallel beta-helix repeat-containing protein, partial [Streptomyces sp. NPDC003832]
MKLFNQEYWEISDLDVSNETAATDTPGANLANLRGIHISGDNGEQLDHFVVDGVRVHDVSGEVKWIGGDAADDEPGIHFDTGWDNSKKTGGIVFDSTVPDVAAPTATATVLNGITVKNSTVTDTSFAAIVVKQYAGDATGAVATGWGTRKSASDSAFTPHTDITISDNYVSQKNTPYGCNGIYITGARGGVVDRNVVADTGIAGIETYYADDIVVEHNEVYGTTAKAGGADRTGIDSDKATTNIVVQYNYVHGNGDGLLFCQFSFGSVTARYNIVVNSSRYGLYLHSDPAATADIHNNTVYNDNSSKYLVYSFGKYATAKYKLRNNAFHSAVANASLTNSSTLTYDNNYYGGAALTIPASDVNPVTGDAAFADPDVDGP